MSRRLKRVVIYGLPSVQRDCYVIPIAVGLENLSSLAITSLKLQLEFPAECLLDHSTVYYGSGPFDFGEIKTLGRTANRHGSLAQVNFTFELLRPKERLMVHELIRVPIDSVPGPPEDRKQAVLRRRWEESEGFCSAFGLELSLWAANCEPVAMRSVVAAVLAEQETDLTETASLLLRRSWETAAPPSRVRNLFARRNRRTSTEFAELVFLTQDCVGESPGQIDPTILRNARTALLRFTAPPWGLTGEISEKRTVDFR